MNTEKGETKQYHGMIPAPSRNEEAVPEGWCAGRLASREQSFSFL